MKWHRQAPAVQKILRVHLCAIERSSIPCQNSKMNPYNWHPGS